MQSPKFHRCISLRPDGQSSRQKDGQNTQETNANASQRCINVLHSCQSLGLEDQQMPSVIIGFSNSVQDCEPVHIPEFGPERDIA